MHLVADLTKIHPVTNTVIDSQLYNSPTYALGIPHISVLDSIKANTNDTAKLGIEAA